MQLIVPNKVYDVLKWVAMVLFPAAIALYFALAKAWGWPNVDSVMATLAAINGFLGVILGVSSAQFYQQTK